MVLGRAELGVPKTTLNTSLRGARPDYSFRQLQPLASASLCASMVASLQLSLLRNRVKEKEEKKSQKVYT